MTDTTLRNVSDRYDGEPGATDRFAAALQHGVDRAAGHARGVEQTIRERGAKLGAQALKQEEQLRALLSEQWRKARTYASAQPMRAAGIAVAAAGLLIGGWLMLRR